MKQRQRSLCENKCGARGRLHRATVAGRKIDLCMYCLKALRKILDEREIEQMEGSEREPIPIDAASLEA